MKEVFVLILIAVLLSWSCGRVNPDEADIESANSKSKSRQNIVDNLKIVVTYDDGSTAHLDRIFVETNDGNIQTVPGNWGKFTLMIPKESIKTVYVWGRNRWPGIETDNTVKLTQKIVTLPAGIFIKNVLEKAVRTSGNLGVGKVIEKKWVAHRFSKKKSTETPEQFEKRKAQLQLEYRLYFNKTIALFFGKYRLVGIKDRWVELGDYISEKDAITVNIKVFHGLNFIVDLDDHHMSRYTMSKIRKREENRIISKEMDFSWRDRTQLQGERLRSDLSGMISILYRISPETASCWQKKNYIPEINMEVEFNYCSGGSFTGRPYVNMKVTSITVLEEPCGDGI